MLVILRHMLLVGAGYYLGAWYGVHYTIAPSGIAVLWPPNAVLLAALLLLPQRQWPFLALAALAAEVIADVPAFPLWSAFAFGFVNIFEATLAATLIRHFVGTPFSFERLYNGRVFLLCGPLLASAVAALLGAAIYVLLGRADGGYLAAWRIWWFGDALGLLVLTPPIVVLARLSEQGRLPRLSRARVAEGVALVLGVAGLGTLAFFQDDPDTLYFNFAPILLLPLAIWAAARFGVLGATMIVALIALVAIGHLVRGVYPYPQVGPAQAVWLTQEYLALLAVVAIGLAIVLHELRQQRELLLNKEQELEAQNASLEGYIAERTQDLEQANEQLRKVNQRLEQLATTDFLTGLANRRHFEQMAQRELNRLGRNGKTAALIMFDLDHFKAINDRHGHEGGDEVLRRIREPVGRSLRPRDLCGRSGGEEFVVLLTAPDQDQACGVAQRIRSGIEAMRIDHPTGTIRVTASFGVAVWDGSGGLDALIQAADAALYRAKDRGRNCVAT